MYMTHYIWSMHIPSATAYADSTIHVSRSLPIRLGMTLHTMTHFIGTTATGILGGT